MVSTSDGEGEFLREMMPNPKAELYPSLTEARIRAVADKTRRSIIAILYVRGPLFSNEIGDRVNLEPNALAYHLNLLTDAGYVKKELMAERIDRNYSRYSIADEGIRFLDFIGARAQLDEFKKEEEKKAQSSAKPETKHRISVFASRSPTEDNFVEKIVDALEASGTRVSVLQSNGPQKVSALESAKLVKQSDMITVVLTEEGKNEDFMINILGQAIASGKPVALLIEAKYMDDRAHKQTIDLIAKQADKEMELLEYHSKGNIQVVVNKVVLKATKLR